MPKIAAPPIWAGWRIMVSPDKPKMRLSEDVPVSPDMRASTNEWMLEFFGYTNMVSDDHVIMLSETQTIWMSPRTFARLPPQEAAAKFFEEFGI